MDLTSGSSFSSIDFRIFSGNPTTNGRPDCAFVLLSFSIPMTTSSAAIHGSDEFLVYFLYALTSHFTVSLEPTFTIAVRLQLILPSVVKSHDGNDSA